MGRPPEASLGVPVLHAASGIPRTISIPSNHAVGVPDNRTVGTDDCTRSRQVNTNGKPNNRDSYGNAQSHKYGREGSCVNPSSGPDFDITATMTNTPTGTEKVGQPLVGLQPLFSLTLDGLVEQRPWPFD